MRILFPIFLILFTFPVVANRGVQIQQNKIHGTWHSDSTGDRMTLKLNADGSGELDGEAIKYTTKDNKFTVTIVAESETIVYSYKLQEYSLTISGGDLEMPMKFFRSGTNVQGAK